MIAHDIEDKLIAADPHNIVRLILPRRLTGEDPGQRGSDNFYADAAAALGQWQASGILAPDAAAGLYVYEQVVLSGSGPGTEPGGTPVVRVLQRGLIGGVGLVPADDGVILPHEDVVPGPVTGRRELMEATQANLEPIYLIYDGSQPGGGSHGSGSHGSGGQGGAAGSQAGAASGLVESVATSREPLLEASTEDGLRHRLWAVTDPAELAQVAADLAPRSALIADGHHRYAAYLQLQDRRRKAGSGPGPWDFGLALLVDSAAYPPQIGAIHRVIPGLAPATAVDSVKGAFCVCPLPGGTQDLAGALEALAAAAKDGPAFLLAGAGAIYLLTGPDPLQVDAAMPPGQSARWRGLAASVLQQLLVNKIWGLRDDDRDVRIVHNDAATAIAAADSMPGGTAVICAPMTAADVYAIAANGERVPRKSTSFGPKPRTGLVIRTFADS